MSNFDVVANAYRFFPTGSTRALTPQSTTTIGEYSKVGWSLRYYSEVHGFKMPVPLMSNNGFSASLLRILGYTSMWLTCVCFFLLFPMGVRLSTCKGETCGLLFLAQRVGPSWGGYQEE